ncbi:flavin-containing amine oxidoreductase-domain containing protein [Massariosphaeria phaeospora]|uniref:Flavin-containing amine oxidoreductase-domain containing protein n=1 Tax=Massariosphaeria phaeospora TaxID=100035 RepID=A0A7C8M947_9PLEO|nr:flavin-containing amine oxidoreductase-domain containing protein [Massariosphaeria phaeospora]
MFSTFAASPDDALDQDTFLFEHAHNDLLSMPMSHESVHLKGQAPGTVPITGLNSLIYGHYSESTTSSSNAHDLSEPYGGYISGRDERDGSASSGHMNGYERSHAPSPLYYPHPLRNSRVNGPPNGHYYNAAIHMNSTAPTFHTTHGTTPVQPIAPPNANTNPSNTDFPIAQSVDNLNGASNTELPMAQSVDNRNGGSKTSLIPERTHSQESSNAHRVVTSNHKVSEFKANSSIPAALSWSEFARQCILAAESSRLNPFALHPGEYRLLRDHITQAQVTIYLNIRNAILRLWTRNPLLVVTIEEAAGCAREKRHFNLAQVAYFWLLRNGYINFGCVHVPNTTSAPPRSKAKNNGRRTVIVIGAGMAGLGCARHLEGLFTQLSDHWTTTGEQPPKVIVLEARPRVGGRVYSHPLRDQTGSNLPAGHRCTAEMGAQIVTGFEHGNPLNAIIRGQLGIPYHGLRDNTILYDYDGTIVERSQDLLVEKLYNDVLERASVYRHKPTAQRTVEGDRNLILFGRDPSDTPGATIATLENSPTPLPANAKTPASTTEEKPSTGVEKLAGRAYQLSAGFNPNISAAEAVQNMGWRLRPGAPTGQSLDLDPITKSLEYPTLGQTMDDGIKQYQNLIEMKPRDLRLLSWHHANLEYANAASVNQLSLSGWDQDIGNEFEGEHTEIIGGYQQVPRGLWQCPGKLDVRFNSVVRAIHHKDESRGFGKAVKVECNSGEVFEADQLVITTPLGVLKSGSITFQPPLPDWKQSVIERMGFGLLNKVILVYEEAFWEPDRDMFGLLNEAEHQASLNPDDYSARRGRFYLFWNCIKTSGKPTLVALMAGEAAHYAETSTDDHLIHEVTDRLDEMFAPNMVPLPSEAIVTRWSKDPFARGSYSYVGPKTQAGDYDVMARPHGSLHFAGEATCGTHPATVHGAYLSGLRVAAEVVQTMIGPIEIPSPLVEKKAKVDIPVPSFNPTPKRKTDTVPIQQDSDIMPDEDYEASIIGAILNEIGERPIKPGRAGINPFLLFTKDQWYICKKECDEARRTATGGAEAKASKTEIRTAIGLKWRTASAAVRQPYVNQTQNAKEDAAANAATYKERVATWDTNAVRIRQEYIQKHPPPAGTEAQMLNSRTAIELGAEKRPRRI